MAQNTDEIIVMAENKIFPTSDNSSFDSPSTELIPKIPDQIIQVEPIPVPAPFVVTKIKFADYEDQKETNFKVWITAREAFKSGKTLPYSFRIEQLKKCKRLLIESEQQILQALYEDLRKPKFEAVISELHSADQELQYHIDNLKSNMKTSRTPYNLLIGHLDSTYVKYDPYGVVLILGPWNYPFCLNLNPLFGAIAAGNCVILKPSEISKKSSALLGRLIPQYLDNSCFHVIQTEVEGTLDLLKLRFDYIFATGSVFVGKSIMKAAAEHLTPVTLELGGKSPVYIDESTNIEYAIKRTMWAKCINLGQSCVAPDYVICSRVVEQQIVKLIPTIMAKWFGDELQKSADLARIINERHFGRLKRILDETKGKVVYGGKCDLNDLWIPPTVLVNVDGADDSTMQDELFGPILPIIRIETFEEAIDFINSKPKPLSLYLFSSNRNVLKNFKNRTSSGQIVINDLFLQSGWKNLPFGGVGDSGIGAYHDKYSFTTFSHSKAILHRTLLRITEAVEQKRYPPHKDSNVKYFLKMIKFIDNKYATVSPGKPIAFLVGILFAIIVKLVLEIIFPCIL